MLQQLRTSVTSIFVKVLLGLIILSFAIWGISDISQFGLGGDAVAEVGDTDIPAERVYQDFRQEARYRGLDTEQARAMGLLGYALQRQVTQTLIRVEADDMGLAVAQDVLVDAVHREPAFQDEQGNFSRPAFDRALYQAGLSEGQFLENLRNQILSQQLIASVTAGAELPAGYAQRLIAWRQETRTADYVDVTMDAIQTVPEPSEEELREYYDSHKQQFTAPEYRKLAYVHLTPDALLDTVHVDDARIGEAYEARKDELGTPEKRTLRQLLFNDMENARRASEMLAEGKEPEAVAEAIPEATLIDIGEVTRSELPYDELAEAAFSTPQGKATAPIETPLGIHVVLVSSVAEGNTPSLDEVRGQIRDELAHEGAIEAMVQTVNQFEDRLGGGATMEEAADGLGLSVKTVEAVDSNGRDTAGEEVADLPAQPFLRNAFEAEAGQPGFMTETEQGGYFVLRVDGVEPSALRPFQDVKDAVAASWTAAQRRIKARELAKEMSEKINGGGTLQAVAEEHGLTVGTIEGLNRSGQGMPQGIPPIVTGPIFALAEPGTAGYAPTPTGSLVMVLREATQPELTPEDIADSGIENALLQDVAIQLTEALRTRHGVSINESALGKYFNADTAAN